MKVTVNRDKLIAAIKTRMAKEKAAHEVAAKGYDKAFETARARLIANLNREAKKLATATDLPRSGTYEFRESLFDGVNVPSEKTLKLDHYEEAIKRLSLCNEDAIVLTEKDNYFEYV